MVTEIIANFRQHPRSMSATELVLGAVRAGLKLEVDVLAWAAFGAERAGWYLEPVCPFTPTQHMQLV